MRRRPSASPAQRLSAFLARKAALLGGGAKRRPQKRPQRKGRGPAKSPRLRGTLRVVLVMALLSVINLYVLYYRHGTSVPALLRAAEAGRQASLIPGPPGTPPVPARILKKNARPDGSLREYFRFAEVPLPDSADPRDALAVQGLPARQGKDLLAALGPVAVKGPGQSLVLYYDPEDQLQALDYRRSDTLGYRLERMVAGGAEGWALSKQERQLSRRTVTVSGTLSKDGVLTDAVQRAGEADPLAGMLAEVFAYELDLPLDARAGDRFRVVVEKIYLDSGFYRYGHVLAATYEGHGGSLRAFRFAPLDRPPAYYNEQGENLARTMLRSPLRLARVPAGLDRKRLQPVLHAERGRGNLGVDYAAPAGTPVRAVAAGKISFHGPRGTAGNTVVLTHADQKETLYTHLSRFARGLGDGRSVRPGQVIGYVGQSGQAPRPHLHFAVRSAGKMLDPTRLRSVHEPPVPAAERAAFAQILKQWRGTLDPQQPVIAQSAPR